MRLATHNLTKSYQKRRVVDGVSVHVERGKAVGLLGPNGAGKTTTFYMMVGIVRPDTGTITVDDTDITREPIHKRARYGIGYLPQEASVFRKLSVRDNLLAILQTREDLTPKERDERANALLKEFGLTDHNVRETLAIVDHAYILNEGKILLEGDANTVAEHPLARKFYLGENFRLT